MTVEMKVGAATVSCSTDYRQDDDVARRFLFERLLHVVIEQTEKWLYTDNGEPTCFDKPPEASD